MPGRGWMEIPPEGDPMAPSRGCLLGILLAGVIWLVILLILWATGVIG